MEPGGIQVMLEHTGLGATELPRRSKETDPTVVG